MYILMWKLTGVKSLYLYYDYKYIYLYLLYITTLVNNRCRKTRTARIQQK